MKNTMIMILSFVVIFQVACSMGSKHDQERDASKTFFWPHQTKIGVFYTQSCSAYKDKLCIEWRKKELDVIKDWDFIKNSRMILINESMFFEIAK